MVAAAPPSSSPHMRLDEAACFSRYAGAVQHYLEFGCGGSTVAAAVAGARQIDSVESDAEWIAACAQAPELAARIAAGTVRFHHADIGPVGDWGKPKGGGSVRQWPRYYLDVWDALPDLPDTVLIDGRFRVACALQALLRCDDSATILFHDFNRAPYHVVLAFVDEVERAGTLAVFRRKTNPDWRAMGLLATRHALDFT